MDFKSARRHMVDSQVRPNDVTDLRLQAALEDTPREVFLPSELRAQAYVERELEYAPGRRLLTVRDFAKLVAAAEPQPGDLVLNAVCGSGYSTAIFTQLTEMVVALESDEKLCAKAQENLNNLGCSNGAVIVGDSWRGAPDQGPYDLIFIDGVIEREPEELLKQLTQNGRLAAIMRKDGVSRGIVYKRSGDACSYAEKFDASAKTVLAGFEAKKGFVF